MRIPKKLHHVFVTNRPSYQQVFVFALATFFLLFIGHTMHAKAEEEDSRLAYAKEEAASTIKPRTTAEFGPLKLQLSPAESTPAESEPLRFTLLAQEEVTEKTTVTLKLPLRWTSVHANRIKALKQLKTERKGTIKANVKRADGVFTVTIQSATAGSEFTLTLDHQGVAAGRQTFQVAFQVKPSQKRSPQTTTLSTIFYAPTRENAEKEKREREAKQQQPGKQEEPRLGTPTNTSRSDVEHPEAVGIVTPDNPLRVVTAANSIGQESAIFISNNGGKSWQTQAVPRRFTTGGDSQNTIALEPSGDPILAANTKGDFWYGEIAKSKDSTGSKPIIISHIAAGKNSFDPVGAALPARTNGQQDKPAITLDNSPTSPTYGRLYVVWNEPGSGGGIRIVVSWCDTAPNPQACNQANNWSAPAAVTAEEGSYIYGDVGVDKQGKLYIIWWDYSVANAIRGATCQPSTDCSVSEHWSKQTVALLDSTQGTPIPFACPILAQPGGRTAPAPQIAIDTSDTATQNTVYVIWGDLRSQSGTSRCNDSSQPRRSHLTWDIFLATASGSLPGSAAPSASVGQRLSDDGTGKGKNADDWFGSVAVDQTNGDVWAGFYSTRADQTRRKAHYYVRQLTTSRAPWLSPLIRASKFASNYSSEPCCQFGNDYGDYSEISATSGYGFPVWTGKDRTGLGQIFTAPLRRIER